MNIKNCLIGCLAFVGDGQELSVLGVVEEVGCEIGDQLLCGGIGGDGAVFGEPSGGEVLGEIIAVEFLGRGPAERLAVLQESLE